MSGHLTISCPTEGHLVGTSQPQKLTTEGVQVIHKGWIKAPLKTGYLGKYSPSLMVLGPLSSTQRHRLWGTGHPQSGFHHKHSPPDSLRCLHKPETSLSHPETQDRWHAKWHSFHPFKPVGAPWLTFKNSQRKFIEQKWCEKESFHAMKKEEKTARKSNTIQCIVCAFSTWVFENMCCD